MLGVMGLRSTWYFQHENGFYDKIWKSAGLFLEKPPSKEEYQVNESDERVQYSMSNTPKILPNTPMAH